MITRIRETFQSIPIFDDIKMPKVFLYCPEMWRWHWMKNKRKFVRREDTTWNNCTVHQVRKEKVKVKDAEQ